MGVTFEQCWPRLGLNKSTARCRQYFATTLSEWSVSTAQTALNVSNDCIWPQQDVKEQGKKERNVAQQKQLSQQPSQKHVCPNF
jgi:hypothetical protein